MEDLVQNAREITRRILGSAFFESPGVSILENAQSEDIELALHAWAAVSEIDPQLDESYITRCFILLSTGQERLAEAVLRQALRVYLGAEVSVTAVICDQLRGGERYTYRESAFRWFCGGVNKNIFGFSRRTMNMRSFWRLFAYMPLVAAYIRSGKVPSLAINISPSDRTPRGAVGFCADHDDVILIPEIKFYRVAAYDGFRYEHVINWNLSNEIPWNARIEKAIWRGADNGYPDEGWEKSPRYQLCYLSSCHGNEEFFTAKFNQTSRLSAAISAEKLQGLTEPRLSLEKYFALCKSYKYQIDVDGYGSSGGILDRLMSGGTVLKARSLYRMWYFDQLKPWQSFVPLMEDFADLVEKIKWLRAHDDLAQEIAANGRNVVLSLDYESQMGQAIEALDRAFRVFGSPFE